MNCLYIRVHRVMLGKLLKMGVVKIRRFLFLDYLVFMTLVVKLKFWTFFISTCKIRKDSHFAAVRCIDMHQVTGWNLYN
jgi:hypothetical protein